jgi:hypothetical protein
MKEVLGYFLLAQAVLTGIVVYSLAQLSDSIKASAAFMVSKEGSLSWGSDFGVPTFVLLLLLVVAGLGIFLIAKKK